MAQLIFPLLNAQKSERKEERRYHIRYHQGSVLGAIDVTVLRKPTPQRQYDVHIQVISELPSLNFKEWRTSARTLKEAHVKRTSLFKLARETVRQLVV